MCKIFNISNQNTLVTQHNRLWN